MRKNRLSVILFSAVILSVIIYSAYGMVNQGKEDDYISVSVIVNDSSNARWDAFREGLEQGAEDNQDQHHRRHHGQLVGHVVFQDGVAVTLYHPGHIGFLLSKHPRPSLNIAHPPGDQAPHRSDQPPA